MNQTDQEAINAAYKPFLEASIKELPTEEPKRVVDDVPRPNPQLIEPKKEDVVLCTYPNTLDGRLAAWVVRGIAKKHNIPVEFATEEKNATAMPGQNHIVLSDSGSFQAGTEGKSMLILRVGFPIDQPHDAPLPFKQWKRTFPFGIETMQRLPNKAGAVVSTESKSLSAIAWDFFYADRLGFDKRPRLIDYVSDRATKNAFHDTAAVIACVQTYDDSFQTLDKLVEAADDRKRLAYIVNAGQAVLRFVEQAQKTED